MSQEHQETAGSAGEQSEDARTASAGIASTQRTYFGPPSDRSLEAYKSWIKALTASVGGSTVDDPIKDSEGVWSHDWQSFWDGIDAATRNGQPT